ncbi:MAG TPA: P1 family peptidase, partial [Casimicrobiaceae bacterium]
AARAMMGLALTGSHAANGSGDYAVAFSTAQDVRRSQSARLATQELANDTMSPLFQAVVEAVEEAIYNALFQAATMSGNGSVIEGIPLDQVREVLAAAGNAGRVRP